VLQRAAPSAALGNQQSPAQSSRGHNPPQEWTGAPILFSSFVALVHASSIPGRFPHVYMRCALRVCPSHGSAARNWMLSLGPAAGAPPLCHAFPVTESLLTAGRGRFFFDEKRRVRAAREAHCQAVRRGRRLPRAVERSEARCAALARAYPPCPACPKRRDSSAGSWPLPDSLRGVGHALRAKEVKIVPCRNEGVIGVIVRAPGFEWF